MNKKFLLFLTAVSLLTGPSFAQKSAGDGSAEQ